MPLNKETKPNQTSEIPIKTMTSTKVPKKKRDLFRKT